MNRRNKIAGVVLAFFALALTGCGYSVPADMVAVHEQKGPFQARKVVGCADPSTRSLFGNDKYVKFPTSEREWDATGQKSADGGLFSSVTKDNVEMKIPVTIRYSVVTSCKTLKTFYTKFARRYAVKFDNDGQGNDGWENLTRKLIKDPADTTLDRIIQDYTWRSVWNDPATKTEIEKKFADALNSDSSLLTATAHGKFFDGISVLVGKAVPPKDLALAVATEQTNVAKARSAQAQADADVLKAKAQVKVAQAEAQKREAEAAGYGGRDAYLKALAVEKGLNPFQPTYIVSGTAR